MGADDASIMASCSVNGGCFSLMCLLQWKRDLFFVSMSLCVQAQAAGDESPPASSADCERFQRVKWSVGWSTLEKRL